MSSGSDAPVVVVGAGLAGLSAAWRLAGAGVDVLVLEARDRVGGRTWSATLPNGARVERGGEFIAAGETHIRELCTELGLVLTPHGFSFDRRTPPSVPIPTDEDFSVVENYMRERVDGLVVDQSAASILPPDGAFSAAQQSIIRRIATSLSAPLSEASARRTFGDGSEHHDPADRVRDGNDAVARELASRLGDRVQLGTPVVAVEQLGSGAAVHTEAGDSVIGSAVVLALPLPLLIELTITPELPVEILDAAAHTRFGDAAKLHLPLAAAARVGGIASPEALWWCWVSAAADGNSGAPALSGFAGGPEAIDAVGARRGAEQWAAEALALRPDVALDGEPLVTHWGSERWTRGSYSAPGIGRRDSADQAWTIPHGTLVFAGEHTAGPYAATMNGAVFSGTRAARIVTERLASTAA